MLQPTDIHDMPTEGVFVCKRSCFDETSRAGKGDSGHFHMFHAYRIRFSRIDLDGKASPA